MISKKPTALIILDGFGFRPEKKFNAIAQAKTPHLNYWFAHYPHTFLKASGKAVGLPDGYIGNSEVGHITIGAGRRIMQPLSIIEQAVKDKSLFYNAVLLEKLPLLKKNNKKLHIMGLLSDAGVHSHTDLLYALIEIAVAQGIKNIIVHPFLDGRDVNLESAGKYLEQLDHFLKKTGNGTIGSISGRFYAMDRDHNWERTKKVYDVLTARQIEAPQKWQMILNDYYSKEIYDEFIPPTQLDPNSIVEDKDGIIFFNFRPDRARQLAQTFVDPHFNKFSVHNINLSFFITPVSYDSDVIKTDVLFSQTPVHNTLKEVLANHDKSILSIAETEKYAHVTYFFSGGQEKVFTHEFRILIPSIVAATYAKNPEMSAHQITLSILKSLKKSAKDFYLINYANADMVGHSGDFSATVKAVEFLDSQLNILYEKIVLELNGTMYITADHGKAEEMFDAKSGLPFTAHTNNPVPFIMLRKDLKNSTMKLPLKELADITPFILDQMGIEIPSEMKCNSIEKNTQ